MTQNTSRKTVLPAAGIVKDTEDSVETENTKFARKKLTYYRALCLDDVTDAIDWHVEKGLDLIEVVTHVSGHLSATSEHLIIFEGELDSSLVIKRDKYLTKKSLSR